VCHGGCVSVRVCVCVCVLKGTYRSVTPAVHPSVAGGEEASLLAYAAKLFPTIDVTR